MTQRYRICMTETEKEYFQICVWRFLHPLPKDEYGEVHHILPKSWGGFDKTFNRVRLTAQEHYRCHELLPMIFKDKGSTDEYKKMLFGWHILNGRLLGKQVDTELFGTLRKEYAKAKSESLKGHKPFKKKRKHSKEFLRKKRSKLAKLAYQKREAARIEARCVYCGCMDHHD